ncbi:MAG: DUF4340 domain-containing protein [Oscillospiraceae bacterium]|nr:DUF4340 domain-containing protein [Oscillospiraceae bacterium]
MNKNVKIIIFSGLGVVILGLTVLVLTLTQPKEEPPPPPVEPINTETIFTAQNPEDVVSIHVTNRKDEGYTVIFDNSIYGGYVKEIADKGAIVPYSTQMLTNMADYVSGLSSKMTVEEDAQVTSKYGLLAPKAEVTVLFKDNTEISFLVGDETPAGLTVYFKTTDNNNIYAVSSYLVNYFLNDRYHWIERKLVADYDTANAPAVTRITIQRQDLDEPIWIESLPERPFEESRTFNTHKMITPISIELEQEKNIPIVYGIFGLTARNAAWAGLEERDYELAGLNDPYCYIEVRSGGKLYTLTIGNAAGEIDEFGIERIVGWYGICSEVPDVLYLFDPTSLPWVYIMPEDIMAELFLMPYVYSVEQLIIETAGHTLTFDIFGDSDNHAIVYNGTTLIYENAFTDLYRFLVGARGTEIFMEEYDGAVIARITYRYHNDLFPDDVIEYLEAPDRRSVIRLNGENIYKCNYMYTARLLENVDAFVNGTEIKQDW